MRPGSSVSISWPRRGARHRRPGASALLVLGTALVVLAGCGSEVVSRPQDAASAGEGGVAPDGGSGVTDGGAANDSSSTMDGGAASDSGSTTDGGAASDSGSTTDGGATLDGSASADGGLPPEVVSWEGDFNLPPQDPEGWSILTPAADSRIVYVSDSLGNDATGATYSPSSPEVGADPFNPVGSVSAFETIDAALAAVRADEPDWVLLRRGDTWTRTTEIDAKSGRSLTERFVIGAYGSGVGRPLIRTGTSMGLRFWKQIQFVAVVGLHFYAHQRDPGSADFVGFDNVGTASGFWSYADVGPHPNHAILIEDCHFDCYSNNVTQGTEPNADIIVRRNLITNNYSASSHSQGMYTHDSSVLLEENLFDHNGWYKQSYTYLNDQSEGQATYFNHNTYFTNTHQTIFRRNLFLRASSIGNKFTANPPGGTDEIMARQVLLDNNLYVEGEIGVSAGGNDDNGDGQRFQEIVIANNVLLQIGHARPTSRSLGWGVDVIDWDGGRVTNNVFGPYGNAEVTNTYALVLLGHSQNVAVTGNVVYGLASGGAVVRIDGDPKTNIDFSSNELQVGGTQSRLIDTEYTAAGTFAANTYDTDTTGSPFRINGSGVDFTEWQAQCGDPGAQVLELSYVAPGRTVETYMASLGLTATLAAFVAEAKQQSRQHWRPQLTAGAINEYVRAGYQH